MQLYSLTLSQSSAISTALTGNIIGADANQADDEQIILVKGSGKWIDVVEPDATGRLSTLFTANDSFGTIRDIKVLRMPSTGSSASAGMQNNDSDYVVVGYDSGNLVILKANNKTNQFDQVICQSYGKSGCRRIVPGQYIAVDPSGRAIMLSAIEKQKYVYIVSRDAVNDGSDSTSMNIDGAPGNNTNNDRLRISSPLEAHKTNSIVFSTVGVDVGFEHNPLFASLEVCYNDEGDDENDEEQGEGRDSNKMEQDDSGNKRKQPPKHIEEKEVVYYEVDLGLNHVVRKESEVVDRKSNMLITVPLQYPSAQGNGASISVICPGGLIVCSENWITYKRRGFNDHRVMIPKRVDMGLERSVLIVNHAVYKTKKTFFIILQSEYGDLYKVSFDIDMGAFSSSTAVPSTADPIKKVIIEYFDTIPPATSICITKKGLLFSASEAGNHSLYHIKSSPNSFDAPEIITGSLKEVTEEARMFSEVIEKIEDGSKEVAKGKNKICLFRPRKLKYLESVDEVKSISPCISSQVINLAQEECSQIYALSGRGPTSGLKIMRSGIEVTDVATTLLPGRANGIWTIRGPSSGAKDAPEYDKFVLVSFLNATLVLSVGESVAEVTDSGFDTKSATIAAGILENGTIIQVTTRGYRQLDENGKNILVDWKSTMGKIDAASVNSRQLIVGMVGGSIIYFELDPSNMNTTALVETGRAETGSDVSCIDLGDVPKNRRRSPVAAIGLKDKKVKIISLDPSNSMATVSTQMVTSNVESVKIVALGEVAGDDNININPSKRPKLYLVVGLDDGVMIRTEMDESQNGVLSDDTQNRFLGLKAVKVFKMKLKTEGEYRNSQNVILALSTRSYFTYVYQGRIETIPLSYSGLEYVAKFSTERCPDGIVAISSDNSLRILSFDKIGGVNFNIQTIPLTYTPRRMVKYPMAIANQSSGGQPSSSKSRMLILLEGDHNTTSIAKIEAKKKEVGIVTKNAEADEEEDEEDESPPMTDAQIGYPKPDIKGCWGSLIRIVQPMNGETFQRIDLDTDEMGVSMEVCKLNDRTNDNWYLIVGTVLNMTLRPRKHKGGRIRVYKFLGGSGTSNSSVNAGRLDLVHITPIDEIPVGLAGFEGRLLVGGGSILRMYELGKQQMLRKSEIGGMGTMISFIKIFGDRIIVGDGHESVKFLRYSKMENSFTVFSDDSIPRLLTSIYVLDQDTVVGSDKFGNLFVLRVPAETSENNSGDDVMSITGTDGVLSSANSSATKLLWEQGNYTTINNSNKLLQICQFFVGEVITSIDRGIMTPGRAEMIIYTTINGTVGVLLPFLTKDDIELMVKLEEEMRKHSSFLSGWDHVRYRSYFIPTKGVVDGDLIERYHDLPQDKQALIAKRIGFGSGNPIDIKKKIDSFRLSII